MKKVLRFVCSVGALVLAFATPRLAAQSETCSQAPPRQRNVVIFVADGLRRGSVLRDAGSDAPAMNTIRKNGVDFADSHALFPTFTTANASAFATGHKLGDTGDFSNRIWIGRRIFAKGNFGKTPGTIVPFLEDDQVLGDVYSSGDYLRHETLLARARCFGYNTAAVGKLGPAAIQDIAELEPQGNGNLKAPQTIIIDDRTGAPDGIPLREEIVAALRDAKIDPVAPDRSNGQSGTPFDNGNAGSNEKPGTLSPNTRQETYFTNAVVQALFPAFERDFRQRKKPFVLVFWSRDPDGTQHNHGDSLNTLSPGVNGPTSRAAVKNADSALARIMDYLKLHHLDGDTDIVVVADHGFSTISKSQVGADTQALTQSYAANCNCTYLDRNARREVQPHFLPPGFLAIDIAHFLNSSATSDWLLFDPDAPAVGSGRYQYKRVDPNSSDPKSDTTEQRPSVGNGFLVRAADKPVGKIDETDAKIIVAANGGSDLIYVPSHDPSLVRQLCDFLTRQDYVDGLFVDDHLFTAGDAIPGALKLSQIYLQGATTLPMPTIVVSFKSFPAGSGGPGKGPANNGKGPANPDNALALLNRVEIADTGGQQGQGMHGSFSRADTLNFLAAMGPDFRSRYRDGYPAGNADVAITVAHALGIDFDRDPKALQGRVLEEALHRRKLAISGKSAPQQQSKLIVSKGREVSPPAPSGKQTTLEYQDLFQVTGAQKTLLQRYLDDACFSSAVPPSPASPCR